MPRFHRTSAPPTGAFIPTRNTRLYGSRDEQIAGAAEYARGCPNPDRAIVRSRRPRAQRAASTVDPAVLLQDCTPTQHKRNIEIAEHNMRAIQNQVRAARERGDETARAQLAERARQLRAEYIQLTGGVEGRTIEAAMPETWASGQS